MIFRSTRSFITFSAALLALAACPSFCAAQSSSNTSSSNQSSSSQPQFAQEKAPSPLDPAGPTISLISAEPVFVMAAALNVCGYNEGLDASAPVRKQVRDEIDQALAGSEVARKKRDALCL